MISASPLDLAAFVDVGNVGRGEIIDRLRIACAELALLRAENRRLNDNVTAAQERGTALLEETRRLRGQAIAGGFPGAGAALGLNGPAGPSSALDPFDPLVGTADAR